MTFVTVPGFSSRSSYETFRQFPQRDEANMSVHDPEPGFSNSKPVKDAEPGIEPEAPDQGTAKVVDDDKAEDKAVKRSSTTKKTAAKKA